MFEPTRGVGWIEEGRRCFVCKGHSALFSSFFYFEYSKHVFQADSGHAGCSCRGWST